MPQEVGRGLGEESGDLATQRPAIELLLWNEGTGISRRGVVQRRPRAYRCGMTDKDAFSPDDWQRIRVTPWVVAIGVIAADPGGPFDAKREVDALRHLVAETDAHGSENDLIRAVAADVTVDRASDDHGPGSALRGYDNLHDAAIAHCRGIVEILGRVADPVESRGFCEWLLALGRGVAEASTEGRPLRRGGDDPVSDAERSTLTDLAAALGVEA